MLPFEFDFSKPVPIVFKHDPEDRKELAKKRSSDDIFRIIVENNLSAGIENAIYNNDCDFKCAPIEGKVEGRPGSYKFHVKGGDHFDIHSDEKLKVDRFKSFLIEENGEHFVFFLDEKDSKTWEPIIMAFLECTKTDTLHKLGKLINKGVIIRKEWEEDLWKIK